MTSVFLVTKVDFDSMENNYANAIIMKKVGFTGSKVEADAWVAMQKDSQYKTWDRETYPRYLVEEISRLG